MKKRAWILLLAGAMILSLAACGQKEEPLKNALNHENPLPADPKVKVTEQTFAEDCLIIGLPNGAVAELKDTESPGSSAQDIYVTKEGADWQFIFHPITGSSGNFKQNLTSFRDAAFVADYDTCGGQIQGMDAEFYAWNVGDGHLDASTRYHQPAYDIVIDYGENAVGAWTALRVDLQSSVQTNIYELITDKDVAAILNHFTIIEGDEGQVLSAGGITATFPSAWEGFEENPAGPSGGFPATYPTAGSVRIVSEFGADPAYQAERRGEVQDMNIGGRDFKAAKVIGDQYSYLYLFDTFNDERSLSVVLQMITSDESVLDEFAAGDVFKSIVESIEIDPNGYVDTATVDKEGSWIIGKQGELAGYEGTSDAHVVIPETIAGRPVTSIQAELFKGHNEIVSIEIPEGVELISSSAFEGLQKLESVSFPSTLNEIQQNAFADCPKLKDVVLPDSVKTIWMYAFNGSGQGSFEAKGAATYGYRALENSTFESITIGAGSDLSEEAIFAGAQAVNVTIGEGCTGLGKEAFNAAENVRELVLPDSMTVLGENALAGMSSLKKLTLPAALERIEAHAMSGTIPYKVVIPETVTYIGANGIGAENAFLMNGNAAEMETDALVCSYIYLNGIYSADDIKFNVDALYISQQIYLPEDATIAESDAFDQFLIGMGWRDITWIGVGPDHFDGDYEDYIQDGNWLTDYVGNKKAVYIPETGNSFASFNQSSIWWIGEEALAGKGLTAVGFSGSTKTFYPRCLADNPDLKDIWFNGDFAETYTDDAEFYEDSFAGVPEDVTVHLPASFTEKQRSGAEKRLKNSGLPEGATFDYYSLRD